MFGLSFGEIAIIFILALLLLGPQKLPEMARAIGKGMRELRRATDDIKETIESEALRAEARDLEQKILTTETPAPAEPVLSKVEGPVLSKVEGPVPSKAQGPVPSKAEGSVPVQAEGPAKPPEGAA